MILDRLNRAERYYPLHPAFAKAFEFLRRPELCAMAHGKYAIDGEKVYATISEVDARPREGAKLEAHRKFIDIQVVLAGVDEMGWRSVSTCDKLDTPYNEEKDYLLYADAPDAWVAVHPGAFTIFFPDDAHAPLIGKGKLTKVVVKVAI